jgi:hypothetical protein
MQPVSTRYQSYLLRLWRSDTGELVHVSLQSTESGGIFHLANLEALLTFLSTAHSSSQPIKDSSESSFAQAQPDQDEDIAPTS